MKVLINNKNEFVQVLNDGERVVELSESPNEPPQTVIGEEAYLVYEYSANKLVWKKRSRPLTLEEQLSKLKEEQETNSQAIQELALAGMGGV